MTAPGTEYSAAFYGAIAEGCRTSAEVVVPMLLTRWSAAQPGVEDHDAASLTVVDVGCGQGFWGAEFAKYGCDVTGLDGGYVPDRQIERFIEADLSEPLPVAVTGAGFDIAVCLEVAEHLPESRAESFVADLCALSEFVVFSAAIPHQGGAGHIHLQWPTYWADLFAEHGYGCDGSLRWAIWDDPRVEPWYAQNTLLFSPSIEGRTQPLDVVCPAIHEWGRG